MRFHGIAAGVMGLSLLSMTASLQGGPIIEDTFTGYPDNALISADPAGPAEGLSGNWTLVPNSNFYVNKTGTDDGVSTVLLNSGGGKIVAVSIRGDQMNGQPAFFDNLRVGLSFAEVMPLVFADGFESGTTDLWSSVTQ